MSENWLTGWTEQKIKIAQKLNEGESGGTYAEATIILCSVLSAIAADIWPGKYKDKNRFVELLIQYSDESLGAKRISVPLLIQALRDLEYKEEGKCLSDQFMPECSSQVITGPDVDKGENEITSICPNIPIKLLRQNCCAHILYTEVRSGYVHQYMLGKRSDSWAMASQRRRVEISYVNRADRADRLIHYNINWLVSVIRSVVKVTGDHIPSLVNSEFENWWLACK